jgi:hypothetical protein
MSILRIVALLALCAVLFCGAAAAKPPTDQGKVASSKLWPPLQMVGTSDNWGMYDSPDPAQPEKFIKMVKDAGFNTERLYIQWNPASPSPTQDQQRQLCNAATQVALNGVRNLILTMPPPPDAQPLEDATRQPYMYTWEKYFSYLFDPRFGCVSGNASWNGQAVPKLASVYVQPMNEMNLGTFCRPQTDTTHDLCASLAVQMRAYTYPRFKQLGQTYGVQVNVIGGGLSSHHGPLAYMQSECRVMKTLGIKSANMDIFGFHPYSLPGSSNPMSGFLMLPKLKKLIKLCYGRDLPVIYDEYGAETVATPEMGYTCSSERAAMRLGYAERATVYRMALETARQQGVIGVIFFLLQDERCLNPGWQSGLYSWDGTPKPDQPEIRQAVQQALAP